MIPKACPEVQEPAVDVDSVSNAESLADIEQGIDISDNQSTVSSLATCDVQQKLNQRITNHANELAKVTGEQGDVSRDPELANGQSTLTFKDVSFSIQEKGVKKEILSPTSGHFEPGSLVALMGPSGCGKTTLLDILAGRKTSPYEGSVNLNGRPRDKLWGRITSYVPQQDIMPACWTVKEAVLFSHRLKNVLPSKVNESNRGELVDMFLKDLGLYEVRDTYIGNEKVRGISGGQRRRVTLLRGQVSRPQVMFADEPTSGLSSTDAEACVKVMRLLAKKFGITIIVVIHQPRIEVAKLFDDLLLFTAQPGRCVYNGPMDQAIAHWESVGYPVPHYSNPTDHFLDMVTPGAPGNQVDAFVSYFNEHKKRSIDTLVDEKLFLQGLSSLEILQAQRNLLLKVGGQMPQVRDSPFIRSFWEQLQYVFRRKLMLNIRDKRGIMTEYIMALFKACLLGVGFMAVGDEPAQLQLGFIYILILSIAMSGMANMPKLVDERMVMKMEVSDGLYHESAYIISAAVINTITSVGANTMYVTLMFLFGGLGWNLFAPLFLWSTLTFITFDSLFSFIAALAKDSQSAQATALPFLLLFVMYNGFTITKAGCPVFMQWAIALSPAAYAVEAMAITSMHLTEGPEQVQWVKVNELYQFEDNRSIACVVLACLCLAFRIGQAICLQKLNKIQR